MRCRSGAADPHFAPYLAIPGKGNGFDIEGLAVDGQRLFLGLRGPVLLGGPAAWSRHQSRRGDLQPAAGAGRSRTELAGALRRDRRDGEHTVYGDLLRHT